MLCLLSIISIIGAIVLIIEEKCEEQIPAENWANEKLYYKDIINGVSHEQRMKNLKNGKYKM